MPVARKWFVKLPEGSSVALEIVTSPLNPSAVVMTVVGPAVDTHVDAIERVMFGMGYSEFGQLFAVMQECQREINAQPNKSAPRRKK